MLIRPFEYISHRVVIILLARRRPSAQSSRRMTFPPHHLRPATPLHHVPSLPRRSPQAPPRDHTALKCRVLAR
jgi:hypothetical protein